MKEMLQAARLFFAWVGALIAGLVLLLVVFQPAHSHAQELPQEPAQAEARGTSQPAAYNLDSAARYRDCLKLVARDPDQAFDESIAWRGNGGGAAARHCEALALVELGLFGDAAIRLGDLADAPDAGGPEDRADLLAQAGNAWLLAGSGENAVVALDAALTLTPGDPVLLADRARAHAAAGNYGAADADLSQVLALVPASADVLVLRAAARRHTGDHDAAAEDISRALSLAPEDPFALVERGALRLARGDDAGARADWVAVARLVGDVDPDNPYAAALKDARKGLEALDVEK